MQDKDLDKELEENIEASKEGNSDNNLNEEVVESIQIQDIDNNTSVGNAYTEKTNNQIQQDIHEMITVRPVKFQEFQLNKPNRSIKKNLDIMQDVSMHISVELGKAKSTIKEVMDLKEGSIVELDKIAGEQVEIYVNNKLVARGEVIVIEDKFGVRVTTTSLPKKI